jgi:hypothetical protein
MAIVMIMDWAGVSPAQYEQARKLINWEGDVPSGARFHVSAFDESGLRVVDLWDSAEAFQQFVDQRLMPGVQQIGIEGQPNVQILPVHATFAPAYEPAASMAR